MIASRCASNTNSFIEPSELYCKRGELKLDSSTVSTRTYDAVRRLTSDVLGNGITETRTYSNDNLLTAINYSNASLGNLNILEIRTRTRLGVDRWRDEWLRIHKWDRLPACRPNQQLDRLLALLACHPNKNPRSNARTSHRRWPIGQHRRQRQHHPAPGCSCLRPLACCGISITSSRAWM